MAGKLTGGMKELKIGSKQNSDIVSVTSYKSILSYQNGSASGAEARVCDVMELPSKNFVDDKLPDSPPSGQQNLNCEFIDLMRKKLISDLSLHVFNSDLENKIIKMEPVDICKERLSIIQKLIVQINQLSDAEKLFLYLKLPSSTSTRADPLRQPLNPLGNRQEIQQTIVWIKTHLEEDREISIPKQDVYDQYLKYCENASMKPLSTADFGKVMKQVYPGVRPRRLGTRGNSRYCYSGMRNTSKLPVPSLPQIVHQNKVFNSTIHGPSSVSQENERAKKHEKSKRKWKTSTSRNCKMAVTSRSFKSNSKDGSLKNTKRSKVENSVEKNEEICQDSDLNQEVINSDQGKTGEKWRLGSVKYEEHSNNSFNVFDNITCELGNDLGLCFEDADSVNVTNSVPSSDEFETKANLDLYNKIHFESAEMGVQLNNIGNSNNSNKSSDDNLGEKVEQISYELGMKNSPINGFQCDKKVLDASTFANGEGKEKKVEDVIYGVEQVSCAVERSELKPQKVKIRRSSSFSKSQRSFKKTYIPIQPKPQNNSKLKVHFQLDHATAVGLRRLPASGKKGCDISFCEESDSQEPEEEIVRYFQHLEENQILERGLTRQPLESIVSAVKLGGDSQSCAKSVSLGVGDSKVTVQARSQSCFENQSRMLKPVDSVKRFALPQRSQSSMDFSPQQGNELLPPKPVEMSSSSVSNSDKEKISHLRVLLEKSTATENEGTTKELGFAKMNVSEVERIAVSDAKAQRTTCPNSSLGSEYSNCSVSTSDASLVGGRRIPVLEGRSSIGFPDRHVPQSPSGVGKYFTFTPISPGPRSPLRTATPLASAFVSPRNTPVAKTRQTLFQNDHFLPPSKSMEPAIGVDIIVNDVSAEKCFNFSKSSLQDGVGGSEVIERKLKDCDRNFSSYKKVLTSRPRSNSSTNFYSAKARKSLSKVLSCDGASHREPNFDACQRFDAANCAANSDFLLPCPGLSSNSLSGEIRQLMEHNANIADIQSATSRSQSVPVSRMISEGSWFSHQASPIYNQYLNAESSLANETRGQLNSDEFSSFAASPDVETKTIESFMSDGQISDLNIENMNEVFTRDSQEMGNMVQISDQLFNDNFDSGNNNNFNENNSFVQENVFSTKIDLNANAAYTSSLSDESDRGITGSEKSYLPTFEGSVSKGLRETSSEDKKAANGAKLFSNTLFDGVSDNAKDPLITSFRPVFMGDFSSCPNSPVVGFFGPKVNDDNQLIEFLGFDG